MAPTKTINVNLARTNQVVDVVRQLPNDPTYKPEDVVHVSLSMSPKAKIEIASIVGIIQYCCDVVISKVVHDVVFDFSRIILPFTWPNKTIRDILFSKPNDPVAIELVSKDCRLTVFKKNDHKRRDDWYDHVKNWRKDLPQRFHLMLNELVENVSAHAQLEESRFVFTVGLLFSAKKQLLYSIADCGVGLKGSLKQAIVSEAKQVSTRACALNLTRPQFTSKGIERGHQGVGLFITSELSQMNKGYLEILSGTQEYEQTDNTVVRIRGVAEWRGTMVHGAINLDKEFNYRQAMRLFADPSKLCKDRFLVANLHLNVYGQRSLRTRELCEEIIHDLELAVERSPKIILDFTDIDEISQAFRGFLRQFVVNNSKVKIMIMVPPTADEDLKEDLQELVELASQNLIEE
ncbi:15869_t:CDS:2 [Funneliformis geosporum]|uniref:6879_t:CDS:1 n=1 Tax=Funneliformis geosporum TaxID=1117311 RepID=A0A9W4WIH9_9GLOM|nr:15869_t:CDS:2 [Funneliformis geosporum]CAI2164251.1 6879_t:CDS:2 [Funneliformis geosporum]